MNDITRTKYKANVRVIGFGERSTEALQELLSRDLEGVNFYLLIQNSLSQLGLLEETATLSSNGSTHRSNGYIGEESLAEDEIERSEQEIRGALEDADMLILLASDEDEAEIGLTPVMGRIAREMGVLIAGVITQNVADVHETELSSIESGIKLFREHVDMLIVVPDGSLLPGFFAALRGV